MSRVCSITCWNVVMTPTHSILECRNLRTKKKKNYWKWRKEGQIIIKAASSVQWTKPAVAHQCLPTPPDAFRPLLTPARACWPLSKASRWSCCCRCHETPQNVFCNVTVWVEPSDEENNFASLENSHMYLGGCFCFLLVALQSLVGSFLMFVICFTSVDLWVKFNEFWSIFRKRCH